MIQADTGYPPAWIHQENQEPTCPDLGDYTGGADDLAWAVTLLQRVQERRGAMRRWLVERAALASPVPLPGIKSRVPSKWLAVDLEEGHLWEARRSPNGSLTWAEVNIESSERSHP